MAYHGKSIYDPEGGAVKTILLHAIRMAGAQIFCAADFVRYAKRLCSVPKSVVKDKLWAITHRDFYVLSPDDINRELSSVSDVEGVDKMRGVYCFRTVRDKAGAICTQLVETRTLTCLCGACIWGVGSCTSSRALGPWSRHTFVLEPSSAVGKELTSKLWDTLFFVFRLHYLNDQIVKVLRTHVGSSPGKKLVFRTRVTFSEMDALWANLRKTARHDERSCPCKRDGLCTPPQDWSNNIAPQVVEAILKILTDLAKFPATPASSSLSATVSSASNEKSPSAQGDTKTTRSEKSQASQPNVQGEKKMLSQQHHDAQTDVEVSSKATQATSASGQRRSARLSARALDVAAAPESKQTRRSTIDFDALLGKRFSHYHEEENKWFKGKVVGVFKNSVDVKYDADPEDALPWDLSESDVHEDFHKRHFILL